MTRKQFILCILSGAPPSHFHGHADATPSDPTLTCSEEHEDGFLSRVLKAGSEAQGVSKSQGLFEAPETVPVPPSGCEE